MISINLLIDLVRPVKIFSKSHFFPIRIFPTKLPLLMKHFNWSGLPMETIYLNVRFLQFYYLINDELMYHIQEITLQSHYLV
jgi:hypothetical protein